MFLNNHFIFKSNYDFLGKIFKILKNWRLKKWIFLFLNFEFWPNFKTESPILMVWFKWFLFKRFWFKCFHSLVRLGLSFNFLKRFEFDTWTKPNRCLLLLVFSTRHELHGVLHFLFTYLSHYNWWYVVMMYISCVVNIYPHGQL